MKEHNIDIENVKMKKSKSKDEVSKEKGKNIVVIIPALNEAPTIKEVIKEFNQQLPEATIYIIDNNSTDTTREIAEKVLKEIGCEGKVLFEPKQGKANAIKLAFSQIDADYYIMVDADHTYPAYQVKHLLEPILKDKADMVVGDRLSNRSYKKENTRRFHNFGNNLVRKLINFLFKTNLKDIMSGYRIFNKRFVKLYPILCEGFELETEMNLHALDKKFKIVEVPIDYNERIAGSHSKVNTIKDGVKIIMTIFRIFKNYRPLAFFSLLSFLSFIFGLIIGTPVIIEFIQTHIVRRIPSAILATGLIVISFILFAIGVILDIIVHHHRFNYELKKLEHK